MFGFASFGTTKIDKPNLRFGNTEDSWNFNSPSKIGLQLQADIANRLSFTTQVSASGQDLQQEGKYDPELQWFFVSYQISEQLRFRIGRLRSAHFLYSETVDVGFSYPWAQPPIDVYTYALRLLNNFNGFDLLYSADIGNDLELDAQIYAGKEKNNFYNVNMDIDPSFGLNLTLRATNLLLHYSFHYDKSSITSKTLSAASEFFDQLKSIDPIFEDISESFHSDHDNYQYHALGMQWDWHAWTLIGERITINNHDDGFTNESDGWYLSALLHTQDWTPYVTVSHYKNIMNKSMKEKNRAAIPLIPAELRDLGTALLGIDQYYNNQERSYTLGTRYDISNSVCIKAEIQYFEFLEGTLGQGYRDDLTLPHVNNATMFSIIMDMVF